MKYERAEIEIIRWELENSVITGLSDVETSIEDGTSEGGGDIDLDGML